MAAVNAARVTPRLIVGLGVLTVGLLWTLDNLGLFEADPLLEWWPVILIVVGLVRLLDSHAGKLGSLAFIAIGLALLLDSIDFMNFDVSDVLPIGIALIGGKLVLDSLGSRPSRSGPPGERDSVLRAFAVMSGVKRQTTSAEFRGGDATAVMGGVEFDLRNAKIRSGEEAVIDAFALWGGVEIRVPENWRVVGNVLPVMGGFEDATRSQSEGGPVLVVRGTAIMGAVEVKN